MIARGGVMRRTVAVSREFEIRLAIRAGVAHGAVLLLIAGWVAWEAVHRLSRPQGVSSGPMLLIAARGLAVNLVLVAVLVQGARGNLNLRAAVLDASGDALGSVGVI